VLGNVRLLKSELDRQGIKSPIRKSLKGKPYGGSSFSRGALYWILKNPAYIGKISHKGKIYEGQHEGIIPLDVWERTQLKLKDQTVERKTQTKRRHMLQGLLFDNKDIPYGPSFTSRHGRQYCYYISRQFGKDVEHPNDIMARLPAHELEAAVEKAIRQEIKNLSNEDEGVILEHILQHHQTISTYDLIRTCIEKITIGFNQLTISIKATGFHKLVEEHLQLKIELSDKRFEVLVPFKVGKEKRGAIVIQPEGKKDVFDLPPSKLKKLVQGFIWRDEHFAGMALTDIALREKCSEAYVGTAIFKTFEIPLAA